MPAPQAAPLVIVSSYSGGCEKARHRETDRGHCAGTGISHAHDGGHADAAAAAERAARGRECSAIKTRKQLGQSAFACDV